MKNKIMENLQNKMSGTLLKFSHGIVKGRWVCLAVFVALAIVCACFIPKIQVEYDLTNQMPKDSYTTDALTLLKKEFDDKGMAYVCLVNTTPEEAKNFAEELRTIDGIANVTYMEAMNFKNGKALYTVNLEDYDSTDRAFATVEAIIDHLDNTSREGYLTGQSAYSYFTKAETEDSILKIGIVIVVLILAMLIFTSKTFFELVLMIIVFGLAVLINMGSNALFVNGISYISNLVALVLQLALSLDYMVILLHRYMEERALRDAKEAAAIALSKGVVEILSSSLTTIAGLGSLLLMSMPIGVEIGLSLGKSIVASLLSVIFLMPALLVLLDKPIMKTRHKPFVPKITKPARFLLKGRKIIVPLFIVIVILSCVGQFYNTYSFNYNGGSMIVSAKEQIEPEFGTLNSLAIAVPKGDAEKERELAEYILSFKNNVDSVNALATIELAPGVYLTDEISKDSAETLVNALAGSFGKDVNETLLGVINNAISGLIDDYYEAKEITDLSTGIRIIDLLEFMIESDNAMLNFIPEDYRSMLGSLTFAKANLESENYSRLTFNITSGIESKSTLAFLDAITAKIPEIYGEYYMAGESVACYDMASYFDRDNMIVCVCSLVFVLVILLFTFKNLLLPLVLILAIQGGIWINFVFPYLTSTPVVFIGYLIITAVQMGATIDYAIVLTNRYRTTKHLYKDRYEGMAESVNAVFPTVITSGLILTGTGFALSFLSSGAVAAMGSLLGVGALTSLLIVLLVLPSLLLVTEKAVDKCDFHKLFPRLFKAPELAENTCLSDQFESLNNETEENQEIEPCKNDVLTVQENSFENPTGAPPCTEEITTELEN